jgi:hypothetical protein
MNKLENGLRMKSEIKGLPQSIDACALSRARPTRKEDLTRFGIYNNCELMN